MKFNILLVICCSVLAVNAIQNGDKNIKFEEEGSGSEGINSINNLFTKIARKKGIDDTDWSEGSGNDDEDSSGSGDNEESGDGSGTPFVTMKTTKVKPGRSKVTPSVVDIVVVSSAATPVMATKKPTTMGNDVEDGDGGVATTRSNIKPQPEQVKTVKDEEESGINFTVGVVVGVVCGAVLAMLIIVFLVYRLRKKDEGSYSLDEQSSAAYLRASTDSPTKGKEYFA